jgi:hypothetical protein
MDIGNLTKKSFTELVDKMLEIMYTGDKKSNDIKKINDLINIVCKKTINTRYKIKNKQSSLNDNLIKILPCNNETSLINKNIDIKNAKSKGSSSLIFNNKIDNRIFKITINNPNSYKSLFGFIFEYFLYYLINKPRYLCKIYEIGNYIYSVVNSDIIFYSIMDKCGVDLIDFFFKDFKPSIDIRNKTKDQINILFNNLLIIFYKMIECVKILHDLGYAHLDIKPDNFLISTVDDSNLLNLIVTQNIENIVLVKIIDFELVRKIGSNINLVSDDICIICTEEYAHPDLLTDRKNVDVLPNYDIESLRKSFIIILGIIFLKSADYESKIVKKTEKFNEKTEIFNDKITKILAGLKNSLENKPNKLDELITILDDIKNEKYKNIDFLLHNISRLIAINSLPNISNKITLSEYLHNILSILVEILFYKQKYVTGKHISDFYSKIYYKYTENNEFILEIIYKILCDKFVDEINDSNENNVVKKLIQNLKKINFLSYSLGDKKNKISDLGEKGLFRPISSENFQEGQSYFYSPNDETILYFGKLENIEMNVFNPVSFKYYIGSDNLCDIIQLSAEDLQKIKFYEFNFSKTIKDKNTKTSSIIDYGSKILRDFKGLFSSNRAPETIASKPASKPAFKPASELIGRKPISCSKYDDTLPKIKSYSNVDNWVKKYCKKNNIIITNKITIEKDSIYFTNERFKDFMGTEIYESGVGYFDCLIRSLLFSLSNNYRCLKDDDSRTNVASYFRRAFLPRFFKENKNILIADKKYNITEENGALYIIINGTKTKLDDLLCPKVFLPDIIGEILCEKLGINLLIFGPVTAYNKNTGKTIVKESEIDKYNPIFNCYKSNFTICISGSNTHFKSCKIMYKKNKEKFILEGNCNNIENSIKAINPITNKKDFQNDTCFSFQNKIYKIHTTLFDTSTDHPEIKYLFSYIPNQIITDKSILEEESVKNYILSAKEPIIFKLNNAGLEIIRRFTQEMANENILYFFNGNGNIYKIVVIDYNTNKDDIFKTNCNINANIKALVTKYSKNPILSKNLRINNITKIKEILPKINTKNKNYTLLSNTLKLLEVKKKQINQSYKDKKKK